MNPLSADLSALLASRICHDLISPIGAISNGVELLQLSGADGPEIALISEAVESANLRIRYFRVAFGTAETTQMISEREIRLVLAPGSNGRKIEIDWQPANDLPRQEVKLAFLALLCLETALPYGGRISVTRTADSWQLQAEAERLNADSDLWAMLSAPPEATALPAPAQLQFALLGPELARQNRAASVDVGDTNIRISF